MPQSPKNNDSPGAGSIHLPGISLPKGGGAIKGLGETFQPNGFSGAASYSIAIPITPARGFEPKLSLDYNSGSGNGAFGIGFSLSLSEISIRTEKGIPRYEGKDIFTLDSGELVPKQKAAYKDEDGWDVYEYLPRVEASFSLIEQHVKGDHRESYWKIITSNNEIAFFGRAAGSRIFNPADASQIFEWLIDKSVDARGNQIIYTYKEEDNIGTPDKIWEQGRSFNNKYIQNIRYGNYADADNNERFGFEVVFDYGEYNIDELDKGGKDPYTPTGNWVYRPDAFSSYLSGFEIRTCRLCRNILIFHHFEQELGAPSLVKSVSLSYEQSYSYGKSRLSVPSMLQQVIVTGYRRPGKQAADAYEVQQLPPLVFGFSKFSPPESPEFLEMEINGNSVPGYLNTTGFQPVDLNGEGIAGLLYYADQSVFYCEPEGSGKYAMPKSPDHFPIQRDFRNGRASLVDLESNGQLELVVHDQGGSGFYERTTGDHWRTYQPFESYPTDISDPGWEQVGLSNNGKTDLLLTEQSDILAYRSRGKKGYSTAARYSKPADFPGLKSDYRREQVGFANLLGDGLQHRIKISNGSVECWPNLGYGKFGDKITLGNAPQFEQDFDAARIFLADVDGSGTIDIIYVFPDRVELYINNSGNCFSEAIVVYLPEQYSELDHIGFSDVLGNGTTCLVFTKAAPALRHYYYDFAGEITVDGKRVKSMKPYLLNTIDNNLGSVTQIQYCSSIKFYLEDKKSGNPWRTRLPFPVQLVEKTIVSDRFTKSRYTRRFKYHDGYYDNVEREFRGFGYVETWDTEDLETLTGDDQQEEGEISTIDQEHYVPPVYTRTWHHTGACLDQGKISTQYKHQYFQGDKDAYDFPDSYFEPAIDEQGVETIRQAYAALSGTVIRTEIYGQDKDRNPGLYQNPYTVKESNVAVKLFQPIHEGPYAVFMVNAKEGISYQYERNPDDPRVQQEFSLTTDDFGNVLDSCTVFLPRRSGAKTGEMIYPEQQQLKATAARIKYVHPLAQYLYCHEACEQQTLELSGLDLKGASYFTFDEIKAQTDLAFQNIVVYEGTLTPGVLQARQCSWNRKYFWDEQQTGLLDLQTISLRALVHHEETAVFPEEFAGQVFDGRLTNETIQTQGGYFLDGDSKYWWNKGLVQYYFPPGAPYCFYLAYEEKNSYVDNQSMLFSQITLQYDPYYLYPVQLTQYVDDHTENVVKAEIDYITHQPKQIIDINNNTTQVLFDPLGQVIVTSLFGTENGVKTGGMTLYPEGEAEYKYAGTPSFNDVIHAPEKYLQGACTYFFYNLNTGTQTPQQPACSINLIRNNYWYSQDRDKTPYCQILVSYSDGLGRELEQKLKVDPGMAYIRNADGTLADDNSSTPVQQETDSRWQTSGRTVYNNKGKPFEQYFPYFINTPEYEDQTDVPGPPPMVIHYDALERKIRVDSPKGFFSKIEFTPWREIHFDEDDTVLDSTYFKLNYPDKLIPDQLDAINKAIICYNTPTVKIADNMGATFLDSRNNLGNVSKTAFEEIVKGTSVTSEDIWNDLMAKGYTEADKAHPELTWLTSRFQPYSSGFKLSLDERFNSFVEQVMTVLIQNNLTSYLRTDISGRNTEIIDARLYYSNQQKNTSYYNFRYRYAMGENVPVLTDSVDAGTEKHLNNIYGKQLWSWSPRDYCQLISYDRLQRTVELKVKKITAPGPVTSYSDFSLVEVFAYGEPKQEDQDKNLNGQLCRLNDLSGVVINSQYSMQGEVLETSRQMVKDYKAAVDWQNPVVLESETYTAQYFYNAIKQLLTECIVGVSVTTNAYNQAGELETVDVEFPDKSKQKIIAGITYDAKGQRTSIQYGNNVNTYYSYEDTTLRLSSIKSTRPAATGDPEIQNIEYYYDPAGNITRARDNSINDVYSGNQKVEPLFNYTYDALYRLTGAGGRQHQGIGANACNNNASEGIFKQCMYGPPPSANDGEKLENYQEYYSYDASGNLTRKQHVATSSSWTKETPVEDNSNRLKDVAYDASGNMRKLDINNTVDLSFNCCENLVKAGIIQRPEEPDDCDYYLYDSGEQRTRKVSERMAHGGAVTLIEDKIYLGNYEIKRNYSVSGGQVAQMNFERHTLRIMDDRTCVAIIHYVAVDQQHPEQEKTRQFRFQLDNNMGSVSLELDKDALLISYEEYFPYGGTAIITGVSQVEVKLKEYRYSGKERDDSTGLYYYGARYYAPWQGRWLNTDPAGTVDGMNVYAFVGGNPISYADNNGTTRRRNNAVTEERDREIRGMIRRGQARRAPRVSTTTKIIVGIAVAAIVVALLLSGGGQTPQGNNRGVVPSGQGSVAPANMRGSSTVGYTLPPVSAPPAKQSVVKSTPPVKAPASAVAGYTPPKEATTYSLSSWKKYWEDRGLSYSGGYELRSKNDFTRDGKYLYVYVKETNSIRIHDLGDIRWSQDLKHSQIAGGKDVYGAGHFEVKNGKLLSIDNASGHYKPDYVSIDTSGDSPQLVYSGGSVEMVRDKVKSLGIDVSKTSLRTFVSGSQIDELNRMKSAKLGFSSNLGTAAVAPDQFKVIGKNGRLEI